MSVGHTDETTRLLSKSIRSCVNAPPQKPDKDTPKTFKPRLKANTLFRPTSDNVRPLSSIFLTSTDTTADKISEGETNSFDRDIN